MAVGNEVLSVEKVTSLVRRDLQYDGETMGWQPGIQNIIGLHGTNVDSVARLAMHGYFSGGARLLKGFNLVPNIHFRYKWPTPELAEDIVLVKKSRIAQNPLLNAIEYAEKSPGEASSVAHNDAEFLERPIEKGLVIAFDQKAVQPGAKIYIDAYGEDAELILPQAPPLETVAAIYPVDEFAARALSSALAQLRK